MVDLYDVCIPVLLRYLDNLDGILAKAEASLHKIRADEEALLSQALRDDMLPLKWQLEVAIGFALRTVNPLLPTPLTVPAGPLDNIPAIRSLARRSRAELAAIPREALVGPEVVVCEEAGQAVFERPALDFVTQYALPNFFFHLTMAYALLRQAGCPIGKSDFDGFHQYAADINLVREFGSGAEYS